MTPSTSETEFRNTLYNAKNIVVVAGAGLSAASGRVSLFTMAPIV